MNKLGYQCRLIASSINSLRSGLDSGQWFEVAKAIANIYAHKDVLHSAAVELDAQQAKIDALMLEYCPQDMTPEQMAEWERNQVAAQEAESMFQEAVSMFEQSAEKFKEKPL